MSKSINGWSLGMSATVGAYANGIWGVSPKMPAAATAFHIYLNANHGRSHFDVAACPLQAL